MIKEKTQAIDGSADKHIFLVNKLNIDLFINLFIHQ